MLVATGCPLCGGERVLPRCAKHGYTIVRCLACGLEYVEPMPDAQALAQHYQNEEYYQGEGAQGYADYAAMKKVLVPQAQRRLRVLADLLRERGRLLDVGCAAGYFLEVARGEGWHIHGLEVARGMAAQAAAALDIPIPATLDEVAPGEFDAITLWEVIEHLPRPLEELSRLAERLRPGGMLMLSTPNTGHWQAQQEPAQWEGYRPPSHVVHFTAVTLRLALERAGLEVIAITPTAPLPQVPGPLRWATAPLQQALARGTARPWRLALLAWRAVRVVSWAWQRLVRPEDDVFATLEALAVRRV